MSYCAYTLRDVCSPKGFSRVISNHDGDDGGDDDDGKMMVMMMVCGDVGCDVNKP
jgi:hypothetical protein